MKVLFAVLSLSFLLLGCEQKKVAIEEENTDAEPGMVGVPPKDQVKPKVTAKATPPPKPGNWMWDKGRGNPLEQRPK